LIWVITPAHIGHQPTLFSQSTNHNPKKFLDLSFRFTPHLMQVLNLMDFVSMFSFLSIRLITAPLPLRLSFRRPLTSFPSARQNPGGQVVIHII
jgi:hypothetical protein